MMLLNMAQNTSKILIKVLYEQKGTKSFYPKKPHQNRNQKNPKHNSFKSKSLFTC